MPDRRALGRAAEDRAARFLLGKGYTLVTRRFTARGGEIDIVALDGDILVFIEVKARSGRDLKPEEALDHRKASRFTNAARVYIEQVGEHSRVIRFDLVAVEADEIRHYPDYFRME